MEAMAVELPEVNADIINALSRTGGVPGPMASDDILVFRSIGRTDGLKYVRECLTTRIPLYVHQDATAPHTLSSDVTLHNGDIVLIGRRNDTDKR
jgi:hypothetical protein